MKKLSVILSLMVGILGLVFLAIVLISGDDLIEMIDLFDPLKKINLSERDKKKLHNIMYSWFHPIKNEWYPYLHNLKNWE